MFVIGRSTGSPDHQEKEHGKKQALHGGDVNPKKRNQTSCKLRRFEGISEQNGAIFYMK
jgi:hypothetical protein